MATWEDGPEYAPLERPAEFTSPSVDPLDVAPPAPPPAAVPPQQPVFAGPAEPVTPLANLVPVPKDVRDPQEPFTVVSSNLTSGSAWGSAHQPVPVVPTSPLQPFTGVAAAPAALTPAWPAPTPAWPDTTPRYPVASPGPAPWPAAADQPLPPPGFPPPAPFPAPGTPEWFGPGAYGPPPAAFGPAGAREVVMAVTPGLLIVLGIGGLIGVLAPITLIVAFALANRVTAGRDQVRRTLGVALVTLGFFSLVGLTLAPLDFAEWWSSFDGWAQFISWVVLGLALLLVHRDLKRRQQPAVRSDWR